MLALKNTLALIGLASFFGSVVAGPIADGNGLAPRNNGGKASSGNGSGSRQSDAGSNDTLAKAPGPSGQLLEPTGGTVIYTEVDWPGFGFHFVYQPVFVNNRYKGDPQDCTECRQACNAATKWLEVYLDSVDVPGTSYNLANYLHVNNEDPTALIDVYLGVPEDADCGQFRVRVIEHQRYYNEWISFQSAAPLVSMQCVRYAGPTCN